MSTSLGIYSTSLITREEFHAFLQGSLQASGLELISSGPRFAYMQQKDPEVDYEVYLIHKGDEPDDCTINDAASELDLPIETAISLRIHSPLRGKGTGELDRAVLQFLCAFAEKWPIVVDNDMPGAMQAYYTNEELFHRLKDGQPIFPRGPLPKEWFISRDG